MHRIASLAALALIASACAEAETAVMPSTAEAPLPALETGLNARLVDGGFEGQTHKVGVVLEGEAVDWASYQARLSFPSDEATYREGIVPGEDTHLLNDEGAGEGELVFAGFATEGFRDDVVLWFEFEASQPLDAESLELTLEVAGEVDGEQLETDEMIVHEGISAVVAR